MDMIRILQFLVLAFGLKELFNAMEYHKQKKKKWVIASLCEKSIEKCRKA